MIRHRRIGLLLTVWLVAAIGVSGQAVVNVGGLFSAAGSARGAGMGNAFSALADDEGAAFHNPAALGWLETAGISTTYLAGFGGVNLGSIGIVLPYVAVSVQFLNSGTIPGDEGAFYYASQGVIASAGLPIGPIGIGVRWRFFRCSSPFAGTGWTLDPTLLVRTDILRASVMWENALSVPVTYDSRTEDAWDPSLRLSVSLLLAPTDDVQWNACFEMDGLFSSDPSLSAGVEAWVGGIGARAGYNEGALTYGLSARFDTLQIDWAYTMRDDLGDTHRIGLALRFE